MSAPERIYRSETRSPTHVIYYGEDRRAGENIAYIRADIHKEAKAAIDALEAENAELEAELMDTRRMLLWLRNHYDIEMNNIPMHKAMKKQVLARVDKLIPSDGSAPDYSDIPHKGIHL